MEKGFLMLPVSLSLDVVVVSPQVSFLPLHVYWLVSKRALGAEAVEMFVS